MAVASLDPQTKLEDLQSHTPQPSAVQQSSPELPDALADPRTSLKREKEVLVGTPVKEGHVNYLLMYDMLTGIRISVSRCNARPPRELEDEDFRAAHKIAFDITGNELIPTSKYDFKFKDYAPWVFRMVRECFHLDPSEYLMSLTGKYVLSELGSPGKSGSFFYFSHDYRFIIKTIHHTEHRFLRKILKNYYTHVKANPYTLISRILGLHRVKLPGNRKIHFVVMGNVFPPNKDIHEVYDLKGSTVGRMFPEKEAENNPRAVLKDLNWMNRNRKIRLGPDKKKLLIDQMEKDVQFLTKLKIMDYSLLIGVHDMIKGNKENIRDNTLSVFEPDYDALARASSVRRPSEGRQSQSNVLKRMLTRSDPIVLGPSSSKLPEVPPEERRYTVFYQDQGGFQGTNDYNTPEPVIYYLGIIDILTKYNTSKKMEHFAKSITNNRKMISAVNPKWYGIRFLEFMKNAIGQESYPSISQTQTTSYMHYNTAQIRSTPAASIIESTMSASSTPVSPIVHPIMFQTIEEVKGSLERLEVSEVAEIEAN